MLATVSATADDSVHETNLLPDVPYIANFLYEHPKSVDLNLQGIWIADPSLTWGLVQQEIPALRFAQVCF